MLCCVLEPIFFLAPLLEMLLGLLVKNLEFFLRENYVIESLISIYLKSKNKISEIKVRSPYFILKIFDKV